MKEQKRKLPVLSVIFYVLAVILVLYAIWALINCNAYISKLTAAGQLNTNGNEFTITSYYMTNCIQYVFYSVIFFFFGKLYSSIPHTAEKNTEEPPDDENEEPSTIFEPDKTDETENIDDFSGWKSNQ